MAADAGFRSSQKRRLMPIPGVFYGGGCSYMACRGLMMGGIEDVLLVTHGPVGCAYFAGINGYRGGVEGERPRHAGRVFVTHMDEADVVFGGDGKLAAALDEAVRLYRPRAVAVCATCPVGLIGDDIVQVCAEAAERHGIDVLPLSCEGFKSQPGWLHGGTQILDHWVGKETKPCGEFSLHYMSESYEGERRGVLKGLFESIGYDVVCSLMGATSYEDIVRSQDARLVVLDSGKAIDAVPRIYQQRYGCGFMRVHLTGLGNIASSLRAMAAFYESDELAARTEEVVAGELARVSAEQDAWRAQFEGTLVAVFEDIFRSNDFATLSGELGMDVIMVAQDYTAETYTDEGFCVHVPLSVAEGLPTEARANCNLPEPGDAGAAVVGELPGCPHVLCPGHSRAWIRVRMGRRQVSALLEAARPQLCFAGIEERFGYDGAQIRCEQFLSDERGCDYVGFDGLGRFARDVAMARDLSHWLTERPAWMEGGAR